MKTNLPYLLHEKYQHLYEAQCLPQLCQILKSVKEKTEAALVNALNEFNKKSCEDEGGETNCEEVLFSDDHNIEKECLNNTNSSNTNSSETNSSNSRRTELHFYNIFGLDLMLDKMGKLFLLEANSNPAIASGTMSDVDYKVYEQLLKDIVDLVVFCRKERWTEI